MPTRSRRSDASRGHPFRHALPARPAARIDNDDSDLKLFALSFTAFFICFYTFLI